jgi:light-regulated signal transduction histidine kinase (bacteriophytochrome)
VSNALRSLISGALQGVLLLEQRHRAEEKLLQSQGQLEALIARLEYANSELESFAYSVSHDLRSPLRAIAGFSSILNRDFRHTLSNEASELLDRVIQNTSRMGRLIDDLLAFSRVGRHELRLTSVDMNRMVQETIDELSPEIGERQVDWSVDNLPPASADPALIRQVWINLLNNAVKYTSQAPRAQIALGCEESMTETVYSVQDNGIGFDMRYADRIFGVFQRLHHEDDFPGTGIGLAIVQRIIQRHGGRVWAESEVGRGSTFYFSLPIITPR